MNHAWLNVALGALLVLLGAWQFRVAERRSRSAREGMEMWARSPVPWATSPNSFRFTGCFMILAGLINIAAPLLFHHIRF